MNEIPRNKAMETASSPEDEKIFQEIRDGNFNNTYELTTLSADVAEILLSKFGGEYVFNNITSLSDEIIERLSKHNGRLSLNGLTTLSDKAAEYLSKHKSSFDILEGRLHLDGLKFISDTVAEHLSKHYGWLDLNGLITLSDKAAEYLSKQGPVNCSNHLSLYGLRTFSRNAAKFLSEYKGSLVVADYYMHIDNDMERGINYPSAQEYLKSNPSRFEK